MYVIANTNRGGRVMPGAGGDISVLGPQPGTTSEIPFMPYRGDVAKGTDPHALANGARGGNNRPFQRTAT